MKAKHKSSLLLTEEFPLDMSLSRTLDYLEMALKCLYPHRRLFSAQFEALLSLKASLYKELRSYLQVKADAKAFVDDLLSDLPL